MWQKWAHIQLVKDKIKRDGDNIKDKNNTQNYNILRKDNLYFKCFCMGKKVPYSRF